MDIWNPLLTNASLPQLTSKRRVGVTTFKGKYMLNIREYYEKDGELLPGKKVCSPLLSKLILSVYLV